MVIAIAYADIERHTAIEFLQIAFYICTVLEDKVNYIQIAMSICCIISIFQS